MRRTSATASRLWHGAIAAIVAAALTTNVVLVITGGADANSGRTETGLGAGARLGRLLSYFTIQSNIIVLAVAVSLVLPPDRDGRFWRVARLDALLGIVITGLVFDFVLAGQVHLSGWALAATIGLHYISPWATLVGWLLFGPRPRITWATVRWAFAWPVAWIAYTFVHGALSGWWPYPFLNADLKGWPTALLNTALVIVLATGLSAAFKRLDRLPATDLQPA